MNGPAAVPEYVPLIVLLALEATARLVWVKVLGARNAAPSEALVLCLRCGELHERTEAVGRIADGVAVGALAFFVALPFLAAGYESGFTILRTALGLSAIVAVIAVAAEINFLVRALASRLWPRMTWSAEAGRIIGGGARWLGVILTLYLFQPGPGIGGLFGSVGQRVAMELTSTWLVWGTAVLLVASQIVALASRWLVPLVYNSLPITFAPHPRSHAS